MRGRSECTLEAKPVVCDRRSDKSLKSRRSTPYSGRTVIPKMQASDKILRAAQIPDFRRTVLQRWDYRPYCHLTTLA